MSKIERLSKRFRAIHSRGRLVEAAVPNGAPPTDIVFGRRVYRLLRCETRMRMYVHSAEISAMRSKKSPAFCDQIRPSQKLNLNMTIYISSWGSGCRSQD